MRPCPLPHVAAALALCLAPMMLHAAPQAGAQVSGAVANAVVAPLADLLQANYVFPETGARYAAALRAKLAAGGYDGADLARAVTADLQAVAPDRHLRLFAPGTRSPTGGPPGALPPPILRQGWIAPGVAYIAFSRFPGDPATVAAVERFVVGHAAARTLILDAREHHGGDAAEMNPILARLFTRETALLTMDTRAAADTGEAEVPTPALRRAPAPAGIIREVHYAVPAAPTPLAHAKVYLLTSHVTASAGEHLALALKRTGRATLIGETTAGAGNYGRFFDLPGGWRAFIPFGRTYDPGTGKGWEGIGVSPDRAVPAAQALDVALRLAGVRGTAAQGLAALD